MKSSIIITTLITISLMTGCSKSVNNFEKEKNNEVAKNQIVKSNFNYNNGSIKISDEIYKSRKINIKYPKLTCESKDLNFDISNKIIKSDIDYILGFYNSKEDKSELEITYEIKYISDKKISIVYHGYFNNSNNAYPINFLCSTNINLKEQKRIELGNEKNLDEIVKDLMNENFKTNTNNANLEKAQMNNIKNESESSLMEILQNTDFSRNDIYPLAFSYIDEDTITISIPVQHAIGDYVECVINK